MVQTRAVHACALAVAGAIALAYLQVAAVPAAPTPETPSLGSLLEHTQADLAWFRAEFPREAGWWRGAYAGSTENVRMLHSLLSEESFRSSAR